MAVSSSRGRCTAILVLAALMSFVVLQGETPDPYQRDVMMRQEASRQTGGRVQLTEAEKRLDAHLHSLKEQEMAAAQFPPAIHFFKARPLIQRSPIFSLLQKMPKGNIGTTPPRCAYGAKDK